MRGIFFRKYEVGVNLPLRFRNFSLSQDRVNIQLWQDEVFLKAPDSSSTFAFYVYDLHLGSTFVK